MSGLSNALVQAKHLVLHGPATISADGAGTPQKLENRDGMGLLVLITSAGTGTSPVLDVKLQHKEKVGDSLVDAGIAFPQMAGAGGVKVMPIALNSLKAYVTPYFDIGGTSSPTFPGATVLLLRIPKYTSEAPAPDWVSS